MLGSCITSQFSSSLFTWHRFCGYTVLVLVAFRLVWGIVGTRYARFRQFVRGPRETLRYWREMRAGGPMAASIGHNPLGAWSVILMLAALLAQASTGLFANDDISQVGPFYGWVSSSLSNTLTKWHHRSFKVLAVLIVLHVLAIAYYAFARRENLVRAMVTGDKSGPRVPDFEPIGHSRLWLAVLIVALFATSLWLAIRAAPQASLSIF